jgi:hypothetical protein
LSPCSKAVPDFEPGQRFTERKKVNDFIQTTALFDAVADFDAATLDPATGAMKAAMQPNDTTGGPGELLHPNRFGYQAMAESINLKLFAPSSHE